jgi:hypothetical protein
MNRLIIPAVLVATGMVTAAAWSQTPAPAFQNKRYFTMLEKDPTREVGLQSVTMLPGAGNQFHRHPGEQWTAVQRAKLRSPSKASRRCSRPVTVIMFRVAPSTAANPATSRRYIEMRIFDKDKPAAEQIN